jgi:ABC-type nickel/cobalt efflux system permease component RcnA
MLTTPVQQMSRHARRACLALITGITLLAALLPQAASAHPLGNFTVNRYSGLDINADQIVITYVLDLAEIPTAQEAMRIDADRNGQITQTEYDRHVARQSTEIAGNLRLLVDGERLALERQDYRFDVIPGEENLPTLRMSARFAATLPKSNAPRQVEYHDDNFPGRVGWQEVTARAAGGVALLESDVPTESISKALTEYPKDPSILPPEINSARFRVEITGPAQGPPPPAPLAEFTRESQGEERFASLLATPTLEPFALIAALGVAFSLGAAHALTPGHGKTVVAAYLVGTRGTTRHALFLGLTTTITHTAGVFALGFITLALSQYILPEQLFPWLGVISGALVCLIGVSLLRSRWQALGVGRRTEDERRTTEDGKTRRQGAGRRKTEDGKRKISNLQSPLTDHGELDQHGGHDHGFGYHTHTLPGAGGPPSVTWRSLLALGVSGGLIPCPSALVILLSAVALGRVGFGLVLIVAFSLGLAGVLTGIGIALVHARRLFDRIPTRGMTLRVLPIASAAIVTIIGVGITVQALTQVF